MKVERTSEPGIFLTERMRRIMAENMTDGVFRTIRKYDCDYFQYLHDTETTEKFQSALQWSYDNAMFTAQTRLCDIGHYIGNMKGWTEYLLDETEKTFQIWQETAKVIYTVFMGITEDYFDDVFDFCRAVVLIFVLRHPEMYGFRWSYDGVKHD